MGFKVLWLIFLGVTLARASPASNGDSSTSKSQSDAITQGIQNGVTAFAANFTKLLYNAAKENENLLIAPVNIYAALATVHLGADGTTKEELSAVLGLPSNDEKLLETHQTFGNLLKSIQNVTKYSEVRFGNGVFAQNGVQLKPSYVEQAKSYYDNEVSIVDFAKGDNSAMDTVNKWISEKTKERIPKLFAQRIDPSTRLLIAASLYFSGNWADKFDAQNTKSEKFNTGSSEIDVQTMHRKGMMYYSDNPTQQIETINIPYKEHHFSMYIVLPYVNQTVKNLVNNLTSADYQQIIEDTSSGQPSYVEYKIPRMKFKWQDSLTKHLSKLGLKEIFETANLDNMILKEKLSLSDAIHAAEIEVHENGTVASAVTVLTFNKSAHLYPKADPIKFHVNRSFLFFITHDESKMILFTGVVHKPNDEK